MGISQSFMLAFKSLMNSKMRSFLTMLGIIIGVAAVITLVSLVNGVTNLIVSSFESLGTNNISVSITGRGSNRTVTNDDVQKFTDEHDDIFLGMSPTVNVMGAVVKKDSENISTTSITGISEIFDDINKIEITTGHFITYLDVEDKINNCVIGTYVAKALFQGDPVGQSLKINGNIFNVIGVLKETADGEEATADDKIYIPYTVAEKISFTRTSNYTFSVKDSNRLDEGKNIINDYLYSVFQNEDLYNITTLKEAADQINDMMSKMSGVLAGIAAISLLVGGIGIMNIMLVSVTERTREIGIRKAIGATPFDILSQFVVEAIATSAMGGIIGVAIGIASAYGLASLIDMKPGISISSIVVAVSVSAAIGVAFGYFPAKKAAKLSPIEALRYE